MRDWKKINAKSNWRLILIFLYWLGLNNGVGSNNLANGLIVVDRNIEC